MDAAIMKLQELALVLPSAGESTVDHVMSPLGLLVSKINENSLAFHDLIQLLGDMDVLVDEGHTDVLEAIIFALEDVSTSNKSKAL